MSKISKVIDYVLILLSIFIISFHGYLSFVTCEYSGYYEGLVIFVITAVICFINLIKIKHK